MCCSFVHFPMVLLGVYHVHRHRLCMTFAPHLFFFLFFLFKKNMQWVVISWKDILFVMCAWMCTIWGLIIAKEDCSIGDVVSCMGCGGNIMCAWWRASLIVLGMDLCFDWICLWLRFWFGYGFGFVQLRFYCNGIVWLGIVMCLFYVLGEGVILGVI